MTTLIYDVEVAWTENTGTSTSSRRAYSRNHEVTAVGPPTLLGSADPAFRGDATRWNPEQLYLASIAQCHMLWYLDLAARAGVIVAAYEDRPTGVMIEEANGTGQFESVTLRPTMTITAASDPARAAELHDQVGDYCFIARSINTPIYHRSGCVVTYPAGGAIRSTRRGRGDDGGRCGTVHAQTTRHPRCPSAHTTTADAHGTRTIIRPRAPAYPRVVCKEGGGEVRGFFFERVLPPRSRVRACLAGSV